MNRPSDQGVNSEAGWACTWKQAINLHLYLYLQVDHESKNVSLFTTELFTTELDFVFVFHCITVDYVFAFHSSWNICLIKRCSSCSHKMITFQICFRKLPNDLLYITGLDCGIWTKLETGNGRMAAVLTSRTGRKVRLFLVPYNMSHHMSILQIRSLQYVVKS